MLKGYDAWKTASPDDERRTYDCDVCGASTPRRFIRLCWTTTDIETFACPTCRGDEEELYEDD
jgi:hypothetical protein